MMTHKPSLEEWNWYVLMLGQALIGAISTNVRMISLQFTDDSWVINTVLESPSVEDEEEMSDVADDLLTFIDDVRNKISSPSYKKIIPKFRYSKDVPIVEISDDQRVIFKRKEDYNSTCI